MKTRLTDGTKEVEENMIETLWYSIYNLQTSLNSQCKLTSISNQIQSLLND